MSGLMRKDWELFAMNKKSGITVVIIALFVTGTGTGVTFLQIYLAFMAMFMALSSISYDEMENGMAYLMTLPVSKKIYIKEKYIWLSIITGVACVFSSILAILLNRVNGSAVSVSEIGITFLAAVLISGFFIAFLLPVTLKFGLEKGRVVLGILCAGIFGCILLLGKLKAVLMLSERIDALEQTVTLFLEGAGPAILAAFVFLIAAVLLLISYLISICIMEKKEF